MGTAVEYEVLVMRDVGFSRCGSGLGGRVAVGFVFV